MCSRSVVLLVLFLVQGTFCFPSAPLSPRRCLTDCVYNSGYGFYSCFVGDDELVLCNPSEEAKSHEMLNSDPRSAAYDVDLIQKLEGLMKQLVSYNDAFDVRSKRQIYPLADVRKVSVNSYAASLQQLAAQMAYRNQLEYFSSQNQSGVNCYAYLKPNGGGPTLPLLISSKIDRSTVKPPGTRGGTNIPSHIKTNIDQMGKHTNRPDGNNDQNGHLIAYENGGPYKIYNFVPMARSLNKGIVTGTEIAQESDWVRAENSINAWVNGGSGYVVQTVVVVYHQPLSNPRPVGFLQSSNFYYSNNSVRFSAEDYYTNDPSLPPTMEHIS